MEEGKRVLSIQSHVVSGYCGNKAATFPLQLLGFDVDTVNTVEFSNHTGYPTLGGHRLAEDQYNELFAGLERNGLLDYTYLLTGYIGTAEGLRAIIEFVKKMRASSPNMLFLCDPVMGDEGRFYVSEEVVPIYRDLLKYSDITTPNQFEAELLTGVKITDLASAREAIDKLHDIGIKYVVISSMPFPPDEPHIPHPPLPGNANRVLYCVGSELIQESPRITKQFVVPFPAYGGYFVGTGDVFSALLIARLEEALAHGVAEGLSVACEKVIGSLGGIVQRTLEYQKQWLDKLESDESDLAKAQRVRRCELRIIQSRADIEHPSCTFPAATLG
ncbi:uncharacterized protein VTP21DRAFT_9804 [Calcarisporiella thermophila]|uniref:uncharacterized protein n=1 Tax=Calcarisporiella thermophila TaxID=911321 RepID=UPI003744A274